MDTSSFIESLPSGWATAPIYRKGVELPNGKSACGKSPLGRAHRENLAPKATLHYLTEQPDTFGAIGVFSGPRSQGLVILDVDANLGTLQRKYAADLEGPHIFSTKRNAGKWLFQVPKELWTEVSDVSLAASGAGFEVLWGRQAVIAGAYAGGGEYTPHGDFSSLPEAPQWLLERMKASYRLKQEGQGQARLTDNRYSLRSKEERMAIALSCVSVIPHQGRGSEDVWWRIGAAIHSELPDEDGLDIWRAWSKADEEYASDWENGDPCAERWANFKADKGIGFGSLIKLADQFDPERARFQRDGCEQIISAIESETITIKQARLSFEEVISKGKEILEGDDTARMNYDLHHLALEAGYRDQQSLEKLLVEQMSNEKMGEVMSVLDIEAVQTDYIIPDVIPTPSHILVYGAGGDGKSSTCWVLAKHISEGIPFMVRGQHVPVQQGKVLILNGDQPLHLLKEQLVEAGLNSRNVLAVNNWNLQGYARFRRLIEKIQPKLVIIDSLIGCSGGRAFDENKSDFATPLYWLTRNNGTTFPATTILMIHHSNKQGGFRGTSAIRDAVDETWALTRPSKEQVEKGTITSYSRLITIEKSRSGRSGTSLIMQQEKDLSFSLSDYTPEVDPTNTAPGSITDRVLQRVRAIYPRTITRTELNADQLVGGNVAGIQKSIQRLVKRCLIEVVEETSNSGGGRPTQHYRAVLSRGEGADVCPVGDKASDTNASASGQGTGQPENLGEVSSSTEGKWTPAENPGACPVADPAPAQGSGQSGHSDTYPRATTDLKAAEDFLNG